MASDSVSLIAVNWNGGNQPLEFLASVSKLSYPKKLVETVIVDNHSTDGSPLIIEKRFPWAKLISLPINVGFPHAVNIAIKSSSGKYIFVGNDDVALSRHSITQMVRLFSADKHLGVLGGKVYYKSPKDTVSSTGFTINFLTGKITSETTNPMWVSACALMVPRKLITEVGLLDEGYSPGYFEDADLCLRISTSGYKIVYDPRIHFYHGHNRSFAKLSRLRYLWYWQKSKLRFILKHAFAR